MSRRAFCGGLGAALLSHVRPAQAAADDVPAQLQATLVARIAQYDRNMKARAGDKVGIVIVTRKDDIDSDRLGAQLLDAFGRIPTIATLPHWVSLSPMQTAASLIEICKERRTSIVYITPSLSGRVDELRQAFEGQNILTVAPSADMTRRGIVLGFELVSSQPKLFLNRTQASRQNVAISAEVLKLMTLYG